MVRLYSDNDMLVLEHHLDDLNAQYNEEYYDTVEPKRDERIRAYDVIKSYVRKKKRIIYGGYAVNATVKVKNTEDAIYKGVDEILADIEYYSTNPLQDVIELCDMLQNEGFTNIIGKEALHLETYTIIVNTAKMCDISYMSRNIYNKVPTLSIDGMLMAHPSFMMIDYLRMFTDPLLSYWRTKKFSRGFLLDKYYPTDNYKNKVHKDLNKLKNEPTKQENMNKLKEKTINLLIDRKSVVVFGYLAYNYYVSQVNGEEFDIPFIDIISVDYIDDANHIINTLKNTFTNIADRINIVEYYPFFQFMGYKSTIYYHNVPIVNIYHHNYICTPYKTIQYHTGNLQIATYTLMLKMLKMLIFRSEVDENINQVINYNVLLRNIIIARNNYLNKNNKNILDDTIFQEFQINCIGKTKSADRIKFVATEKRKKNKKKEFKYDPEAKKKPDIDDYKFANTTGNRIRKERNKKL